MYAIRSYYATVELFVTEVGFAGTVPTFLDLVPYGVLDAGDFDAAFLDFRSRITSYNVCYTKLLRVDSSRHSLGREIKAVTRHAMTVEERPGGFVARFLVDV